MEEQEKIDIREHLIGWIDTFLEDGIVPKVVNPKAIRANYVQKSKIKEKIEEIQNKFGNVNGWDSEFNYAIEVLQELLGDE